MMSFLLCGSEPHFFETGSLSEGGVTDLARLAAH